MSRLRLFCRLRGIELPYQEHHEPGRRLAGARKSPQVRHRRSALRHDCSLLRPCGLDRARRRLQTPLYCVREKEADDFSLSPPSNRRSVPSVATSAGKTVSDILAADHRRKFRAGKRLATSCGVPVLEAGPRDSVAVLAARIAAARSGRRAA